MARDSWERLEEVAARQTGLITRKQALAAGFKNSGWAREVEARSLPQLERGLYAVRPVQSGEHRDLHSAVLVCGKDAVVSHRAAARLHKLWGVDGFPLELTVPRRLRFSLPSVETHWGKVPRSDLCEVDGLPVTTRVRTLLDLAPMVDRVGWAMMLESARRRQRNVVSEVARRLRTLDLPTDTVRPLSVLLADCNSRTRAMDSPFEVQFWHRWAFTGLPMPTPQYEVRDGNTIMFIDFAWPKQRVAVETQGFEPRYTRDSFDADGQRNARLVRLGWFVIEVTYTMFRDEFFGGVTGAVARALAEHRPVLAVKAAG